MADQDLSTLKDRTRTELIRFIEEARSERDGALRDSARAFDERAVLIEENRRLLSELAFARHDSKRLDWLDGHWYTVVFAKSDKGYLPWVEGADYQPTLRMAIDVDIHYEATRR